MISEDNAQSFVDTGLELYEQGHVTDAMEHIERALRIDPEHGQAWFCKGVFLGNCQHYEEAIECYQRSAECAPDHAHLPLFNMGNCYQELQRFDMALKCFTHATEILPDMADAWINRGRILDDQGDHRAAIDSYDRALEYEPEDAMAWSNRGNSLRSLGEFHDSIESYRKALEYDPEDVAANIGLAACLGKLEKPLQGLKLLSRIPRGEQIPEWHFERALLLTQTDSWSEALEAINQTITLGLTAPEIWNNRGEILAKVNKAKSALESFNKALKMDRRFAPAWFGKARLLLNNDYVEEARKCIDNYFKVADADDALHEAARALAALCADEHPEIVENLEIVDDDDEYRLAPEDDDPMQVVPGKQLPSTQCACCQAEVHEYFGKVQEHGRDVAAYWLHLPSAHPGQFYLAILRRSAAGDRRIVVLSGAAQQEGVIFRISDQNESPWSDLGVGRILSRAEGLGLEDRADYFATADFLTINEPRLREFVIPHLGTG